MSIDQDIINQMYPSTTPVQTNEVQPETTPVDAAENYGYEPDPEPTEGNPYSLETGSVEDTLYGAESKVALSDDTDLSIIYQGEEEQTALRENLGYMASEVGADQADIHSIVSHANRQLITGELADPTESISTLYDQHGAELTSKLADAQVLVESFPELVTWLEATQLGNDPVVINHIIRIAQSPRAQARLQKSRGNK